MYLIQKYVQYINRYTIVYSKRRGFPLFYPSFFEPFRCLCTEMYFFPPLCMLPPLVFIVFSFIMLSSFTLYSLIFSVFIHFCRQVNIFVLSILSSSIVTWLRVQVYVMTYVTTYLTISADLTFIYLLLLAHVHV